MTPPPGQKPCCNCHPSLCRSFPHKLCCRLTCGQWAGGGEVEWHMRGGPHFLGLPGISKISFCLLPNYSHLLWAVALLQMLFPQPYLGPQITDSPSHDGIRLRSSMLEMKERLWALPGSVARKKFWWFIFGVLKCWTQGQGWMHTIASGLNLSPPPQGDWVFCWVTVGLQGLDRSGWSWC